METIVERHPTMKILVMSGLTDQHSIVKVLQMGAAGFIPKSLDAALLTAAIRFVLNGGVYIPVKLLAEAQRTSLLTSRDAQRPNVETVHLTERQKDVLALLAKGAPIKRICKELNLSEGTVKTHVTAIYRAFNATNRTEALLEARRHGFEVAL
jgi:DNA-binding NarL/FixJ family response regulator